MEPVGPGWSQWDWGGAGTAPSASIAPGPSLAPPPRIRAIARWRAIAGLVPPAASDTGFMMLPAALMAVSFPRRLGYGRSTQKARTNEYAAVQHRIIAILPKRPP